MAKLARVVRNQIIKLNFEIRLWTFCLEYFHLNYSWCMYIFILKHHWRTTTCLAQLHRIRCPYYLLLSLVEIRERNDHSLNTLSLPHVIGRNLASVHWCWVETRRPSVGEGEENSFNCFARQRRLHRVMFSLRITNRQKKQRFSWPYSLPPPSTFCRNTRHLCIGPSKQLSGFLLPGRWQGSEGKWRNAHVMS